jgi:hypothetical protein
MNVSVSETLGQHRKIPHICALFKNWRNGMESYWGLVIRTMPPQQGDQDRKQRTDTGKYSFVHTTIKLWNLQRY